MNAPMEQRTLGLAGVDRVLADNTSLLAGLVNRLPSAIFHRFLDRLDTAFGYGMIEVHLPDGSVRIIGGRGPGPAARIRLHSWSALVRLMLSGSIGWFRSWMAGEWESDDPVSLFAAFSTNRGALAEVGRARGPLRWLYHIQHWRHRNSRSGSRRNIRAHYDLGNDFYASWLDRHMVYSGAIFDPDNPGEPLETAQLRKIDAVLARLGLKPGDSLLEIGCGWGGLGARAIEQYDVQYTGLTISEAQADWARRQVAPDGAIVLQDYRDIAGQYDAIASVEMVEAVGKQYWPDYLDAIARTLKPGGRAAIQYIAIDDAIFERYAVSSDFIQSYVFPGGCLISSSRFKALAEERGLHWQDQREIGLDYALTLKRWRERFDAAMEIKPLPAEFCRLWRYYLMYCEAGFRGGGITAAQVTLEKTQG